MGEGQPFPYQASPRQPCRVRLSRPSVGNHMQRGEGITRRDRKSRDKPKATHMRSHILYSKEVPHRRALLRNVF